MGGMFNYKTHATRERGSNGNGGQGWVPMKDVQGDRATRAKHHGFAWNELRQGAKLV